jgi:hypothetical protein
MSAGDDDIDFVGSRVDRLVDFLEAEVERGEAGGESGADRGDGDTGSGEAVDGVGDVGVIDADGSGVEFWDTEFFEGLGVNGLFCFGAESVDVAGGVIAAEGGEIDAFDGSNEIGGLVVFFDGPSFWECLGAPFDGGFVGADGVDNIEIERGSGVSLDRHREVGFRISDVMRDGLECDLVDEVIISEVEA